MVGEKSPEKLSNGQLFHWFTSWDRRRKFFWFPARLVLNRSNEPLVVKIWCEFVVRESFDASHPFFSHKRTTRVFSDVINIESITHYLHGIVTNTRSAVVTWIFIRFFTEYHRPDQEKRSRRLIKLRTNGMSRAFYMLLQITQYWQIETFSIHYQWHFLLRVQCWIQFGETFSQKK